MKVLFIIDSLEGYGAEKSIVHIATSLQNVSPVFIHLYKGDKLKPLLERKGIKVYSLNIASNYGYKEAVQSIIPLIEKEQPQIVHSTLFRADMVARKLKLTFPDILLVGSFVSNSYGLNRYNQLSPISAIKLFTTQCKDKLTAGKVDYFICNSEAIKVTNVKALGIPEDKVKVIYRGRCVEKFEARLKVKDKLKQVNNLEGRQVLLNVGRLNKGKGQFDLIKAFSLIHKNFPQLSLLFAGEGNTRKELEVLIQKLKLEDKVHLLGYREDIQDLLTIADFFVFPTYFEGLPGALIEAILSKTPSIVSDIPENRECFPEEGALFFKAGDVENLTATIHKALTAVEWQEKVEKSFENAREKFDIHKVSEEYENFYKDIIQKKN